MLVYTDLVSGDQVLSDSYEMQPLKYEDMELEGINFVQSKMVAKSIGDINTGANASAENPDDEAVSDEVEKVCDLKDGLIGFGYEGPNSFTLPEFAVLYKAWCGKVKKKIEDSGEKPGPFMKSAKQFLEFIKKEFKNCEIYSPKSFSTETFIVGWWDDEANAIGSPKFIYFKHAMKEEKY